MKVMDFTCFFFVPRVFIDLFKAMDEFYFANAKLHNLNAITSVYHFPKIILKQLDSRVKQT